MWSKVLVWFGVLFCCRLQALKMLAARRSGSVIDHWLPFLVLDGPGLWATEPTGCAAPTSNTAICGWAS
jgi:hypothetical protein